MRNCETYQFWNITIPKENGGRAVIQQNCKEEVEEEGEEGGLFGLI